MAKKLYNVKLKYKIPPAERNVYRANANPEEWVDQYRSEELEVGEEAQYGQWLTEEALHAFLNADNVEFVEEAQIDQAYEDHLLGNIRWGVDGDVLSKMGFFDDLPFNGKDVVVMVCDTGATTLTYVRKRMIDKWTWFSDDGMDRNGHGSWCLGAATPSAAKVISAKVLSDSGSGTNTNIIASWNRFSNLVSGLGQRGVISCSLGGNYYSQAYEDAARYAESQGVIVVAASGNEGRRDGISAPANAPSVISVGASHWSLMAAPFSNRTSNFSQPDIWAIGVDVNGIGGKMSGTSMATPLVARAVVNGLSVPRTALDLVKEKAVSHGGRAKILNQEVLINELRGGGSKKVSTESK